MNNQTTNKIFIDRDKIYGLTEGDPPSAAEADAILNKALELKGLDLQEAAALLRIDSEALLSRLFAAAGLVKEKIYGKRLVLFAPLYTGNVCSNNCLYCAFRKDNKALKRKILSMEEIEKEVYSLLAEGHKRLLMICGESENNNLDYFIQAISTAYAVRNGTAYVRRINAEIAPLDIEGFRKLKKTGIGTYVCFQETYDPVLYEQYHPAPGPKADYEYRLTVMDRAMRAGIDDVGIGALFGLADYRFEVLSLLEHAAHLEKEFGCGPHTVSVPRIEPADNAPLADKVPCRVSDTDFKKLIAVIRISLPYTGIILSTRETEKLRSELFQYGVSQISAGSRTNPGAYSEKSNTTGSQFSLGDHRSLDEVISGLIDKEHIPSFCTGCYRKGRGGNDFMDLAKPGLIKEFCMPNAVFTFKEYLNDYAAPATKAKGLLLIERILAERGNESLAARMREVLDQIENGERDIYF